MPERLSMYALKKQGLASKSISHPEEGFYEMRGGTDGHWIAVHIWFGPSKDPVTGEPCDRSPCWHAVRDGIEVDAHEIWPWCCGRQINQEQYLNMMMEDL
jgi:hypothetical protein